MKYWQWDFLKKNILSCATKRQKKNVFQNLFENSENLNRCCYMNVIHMKPVDTGVYVSMNMKKLNFPSDCRRQKV